MKLNHVGIDISAKTFTEIIDHEWNRTEAFDLANETKGHKKLIRMITKKGFSARVVLDELRHFAEEHGRGKFNRVETLSLDANLSFQEDIARCEGKMALLQELLNAGADLVFREIEDLSHAYARDENARILAWFLDDPAGSPLRASSAPRRSTG